MKPSLNRKWLGLIALMGICFTLSRCQYFGKQIVDGGHCNYTTKIYPAKIVAFTTYDSIHWDLVFERNRNNLIDSFTYSYATKNYFLKEELSKYNIGNTYQWKEMNIIDGHCNPHVNSLIMQPYQSTNLK
jgi:hypothetical protein